MIDYQAIAYLGNQEGKYAPSIIKEGGIFVFLLTERHAAAANQAVLEKIEDALVQSNFSHLAEFNQAVDAIVRDSRLPIGFSLACGYLKDNLIYIKTVGEGVVYLKKNHQFARLISGTNSASGYIDSDDVVIFSTVQLADLLAGETALKKLCLTAASLQTMVDQLGKTLPSAADGGAALLVQFQTAAVANQPEPPETSNVFPEPAAKVANRRRWGNVQERLAQLRAYLPQTKSRKLTIVVLLVIFLIFVWSVGLGVKRRALALQQEKITNAKQAINAKLQQADDEAYLDLPQALTRINEANQILDQLTHEVKSNDSQEIPALRSAIQDKENQLLKKEEKGATEFFDLALEEKNARADIMSLDQDQLAAIDKNTGDLFLVSLEKKSLTKKNYSALKQAGLVAVYNDAVFGYGATQGVDRVDGEGELKTVIVPDKDWGKIKGIWVYNSNVYLLDQAKNDIYKYAGTSDGFGTKTSYLKPDQAVSFAAANSLAIDSSVYVGFSDHVVKYTAGLRDGFVTAFPSQTITITKIYTNKDLDRVYGWDKQNGAVYVMEKNGTYEKQINASIFKKISDFVVYQNNIYGLKDNKIYQVSTQ
ncbi:hypothetical protein M1523_02735 [Patescibacteria group bacterium]|nr:hypothetical protein [Patescibacteria group bacterium]MCL5091362.1 hypothetical protein [Patescibacteria group bacterium]